MAALIIKLDRDTLKFMGELNESSEFPKTNLHDFRDYLLFEFDNTQWGIHLRG